MTNQPFGGPLDPARPAPVRPPIGASVHVLAHYPGGAATACRPAIVLDHGDHEHLYLRVIIPGSAVLPVGGEDREGWYAPGWHPQRAPSPDGTLRDLDSWHWPYHPDGRPG